MTYHARIILTVMNRHITTLSGVIDIGEKLAHEILKSKSTLLKYTCLAILSKYHIIGSQSCCRANSDTLFAGRYLYAIVSLALKVRDDVALVPTM